MSEESEAIDREVCARLALHDHHASRRPLSEGYEKVGFAGEVAFARAFNLALDWERKPSGDGGHDFIVPVRFTLDIKTARKPFYLIQEQGKITADIYVLAQYCDDGSASLVGWEFGTVLAKAPSRDFGHGIISRYIPRDKLRSIDSLGKRIMKIV